MSTYRENLCNKDEKGVSVFSPLCFSGKKVNYDLHNQTSLNISKNENSKTIENKCYVSPVEYPKKSSSSLDDSESAKNWFKDPTYAQRIANRVYVKNAGIFDNFNNESSDLQLYHLKKSMERTSGSLMQTL